MIIEMEYLEEVIVAHREQGWEAPVIVIDIFGSGTIQGWTFDLFDGNPGRRQIIKSLWQNQQELEALQNEWKSKKL